MSTGTQRANVQQHPTFEFSCLLYELLVVGPKGGLPHVKAQTSYFHHQRAVHMTKTPPPPSTRAYVNSSLAVRTLPTTQLHKTCLLPGLLYEIPLARHVLLVLLCHSVGGWNGLLCCFVWQAPRPDAVPLQEAEAGSRLLLNACLPNGHAVVLSRFRHAYKGILYRNRIYRNDLFCSQCKGPIRIFGS